MSNSTLSAPLPPLPSYDLTPRPNLLGPISDKVLVIILPTFAYWVVSLFFHYIDVNDYLPQYRLHTPAEVLKRNRVSRGDVVRDVILQQIIQAIVGFILGLTEPDEFLGKDNYNVSVWARRLRVAQKAVPTMLGLLGVDANTLANSIHKTYPTFSGFLAGGVYPWQMEVSYSQPGNLQLVPTFARWEIIAATAIYWYIVPAMQFLLAIIVVDTWQYFLHRAMHMNLWLYKKFHSRHHRLYVPYAFGALYNHPFEGFLLDTCGAGLAYMVTGMNTRQGMWLFTCLTIKTVDDHCGYSLPFDPLQYITSNNAGYHDVHHQSWGIKTNFSQPCTIFWDRLLGTMWTGGDVSARYERSKKAAQRKVDLDMDGQASITNTESTLGGKAVQQAVESQKQVLQDTEGGGDSVLKEELEEEKEAQLPARRTPRKKSQSNSLKSLTDRVNGSAHGRTGGVLGMESSH